MKATVFALLCLAGLTTLASCAHTQQIVVTPKGTYRFYSVGNNPTLAEYCVLQSGKPSCKDVKITFE